mmetsp:Transcript_5873/g.5722  ORF Transcript_5873/g.5722 Transcript_5873/m.5722 type:complete len:312 (-) Transcript_5873:129-1064(-)
MKRYTNVSDSSDNSSRLKDSDSLSVVSISSRSTNHRRFNGHKRINSELSEPLTSTASTVLDRESSSGDPYFVFRSDLQTKLELADEFLADFLRIVHETDTAVNSLEYKDSKKQLKRHLKNSAESTLRDVQITVQAIENDRDKFPHIDDSQLFERKSLVETSRSRIQHAKDEMNSDIVKKKLVSDERNKAVRRSGDGLLGAKNDEERQNTDFILDNQAQSSMLIQEQDETLDELGDAVTRVGEMAGTIGEEIGQQNKMLDNLDQDMTNAEEELGLVLGKLAKFIGTKDRWQLRTIMILILIVIIMFFLAIYS